MKTPLKFTYLAVASCALSVSANAAIINIVDMTPDFSTGTGNPGNPKTVSGFTVTASALVGNAYTFSFTQTGDLDGAGVSDDTLSFDLIYTGYTGSTFSAGDVTLGTATAPKATNNINWFTNGFSTGDTLYLEVANLVYTDGEGDETAAFTGFTSIRLASYGSTPTGNISYYEGVTGATTYTGDPSFEVDFTAGDTISGPTSLYFTAASGPVRLRDVNFGFEVIPEPGTYALLAGLTGLMFVMLRRRRA